MKMSRERWWNDTDREKPNMFKKIFFELSATLVNNIEKINGPRGMAQ
jgi:hypothetical protein